MMRPRTLLLAGLAASLTLAAAAGATIRLASLELVQDGADGEVPEVTFTMPLEQGGPEVEGKSLEQLLRGSPVHPPLDGLPETLWKGKICSTCHQWSREDLCEHGRRYVGGALQAALAKRHPYGGGFKQNVYFWAKNGCK